MTRGAEPERRADRGLGSALSLQTGGQAGGADNQADVFRASGGGAGGSELGLRREVCAALVLRLRGAAAGRAVGPELGAMATFVSELEAAKKNLSEALGDNVKQ